MKRYMLLCIALSAVMIFSSCEKRRYEFVATLNRTADYVVDQTGAFNVVRKITAAEMRSNLNVPDDATIIRVDIEALSVVPETKAGNKTENIKINGYIKDQGSTLYMFKDQAINLKTGVDVGWGVRVPLKTLIDLGISSLKKKINDQIKRINNADIEIGISGDTVPAGQRTLMTIHFEIKATIIYEQCISVPFFSGGEKCEEVK